ncbi:MAG: DUF2807 domain-containing protein [Saprospirales bacterium]|nr:MAG: DUF2807 domain-containing protein [Saprospirales bacterium]
MKNSILLSLWIFFVLSSQISCVFINYNQEKGSGNIITETRSLDAFSKLHLAGSHHVQYVRADGFSIEITGDDNLMEFIKTEVKNDELSIKTKQGVSLSPSHKIQMRVTAPNVSDFNLSGSGNINIDNLVGEEVNFQISGSGNIAADLAAIETISRISGSGSVRLTGNSEIARFIVSGSGSIQAGEMESKFVSVNITGSGSVATHADTELDIKITGSGNLRYSGNPAVNQSVTGSGRVRKVD